MIGGRGRRLVYLTAFIFVMECCVALAAIAAQEHGVGNPPEKGELHQGEARSKKPYL